jgi:hypothetical protein
MTRPAPVDWPAIIAEVYGQGDAQRGRGPRRRGAHWLTLVALAEPEAVDWRARLATFRADLDTQRRSA